MPSELESGDAHGMDDIARAYAELGLPQGARYAAVRRRYRLLAKRWNPGRFGSDPDAQAAAAARMSALSAAYARLVRALRPSGVAAPRAQANRPALSRSGPEHVVASIWSDSPVDWVFDGLDGIGGCLGAALFLVGAVFLVFRVLHLLLMAQFSELRHLLLGLVTDVDGLFLITLAVGVAVLAIRGKRRRRALDAHERAAGRAGGAGEAR